MTVGQCPATVGVEGGQAGLQPPLQRAVTGRCRYRGAIICLALLVGDGHSRHPATGAGVYPQPAAA